MRWSSDPLSLRFKAPRLYPAGGFQPAALDRLRLPLSE